jgi:putative ABC transport system substrate-binding protein
MITDAQAAAATIGKLVEILPVGTDREIDAAFASLVQNRADALMVGPHPLFNDRRVQILTLAARYTLPTIYSVREFPQAGGLMSYGPDNIDQARLAGIYTGRVLKGEKPADLPVMMATKFEFVINLQTARTLGIEVPATMLARADEVIE